LLLLTTICSPIVAVLAAGTAVLLHRKSPDQTAWAITLRTVFVIIVAIFVLTIALIALFSSGSCPPQGACDMPAMAASGAFMLGALALVVAIVVGGPIAYATTTWIKKQ
jgi:hypothetical protein